MKFLIIYFLYLLGSSWILSESAQPNSHKYGLIVIPGLGRSDRLNTVVNNLKFLFNEDSIRSWLNEKNMKWDCIVYIYAPRTDESFWKENEKISFIRLFCDIIENPNKKVTENLFLLQPSLMRRSYEYIFLILDDIKIMDEKSFSLMKLMHFMECNKLSIATPAVSLLILASL